ncbi:MFS transporter small subunit [Crossiella sp. CA198]
MNPRYKPVMAFAWLWVGLPFAYGLFELVRKVTQLFTG